MITVLGTGNRRTAAPTGGGGSPNWSGGSSVTPDLEDDFSSYTSTSDLNANTAGLYEAEEHGGPWGNWTRCVFLDQTTGVGDVVPGASSQSMSFVFPDRTNDHGATGSIDPPICEGFYVIKAVQLRPSPAVTETWMEFFVKFSTNFTSKTASLSCPSNPDWKYIFVTTNGNRFSLKNDTYGTGQFWDPTAPGQGDGDNATGSNPAGTNPVTNGYYAPNNTYKTGIYDTFHDDEWHRIRVHAKLATSGANGEWTVYLDNHLLWNNTGITTASQTAIVGLSMGNNMNQGPDHVQTHWWGGWRIWYSDPSWTF
jgi:hypothetical protein